MKKAIIILGSPKAKGNTSRLVDALVAEIDNCAEIKKVELSKLNRINHCIGCDSCKKNERHKCVFNDGMNEIIEQVRNSDLIVIASPIYFFNFNSLTKAFIDRLFYSSEINNNENLLRGKKIGLMVTYGLNNVIDSGAKNAIQSFYDMSRFVGLEIIGLVYGSFGEDNEQNEMLLNKARNLGKIVNKEILA